MSPRDFTTDRDQADVVLTSADGGEELYAHSVNLACGSEVFKGMFDSTKPSTDNTKARITLEEPTHVLQKLLPYFYPEHVSPVKLACLQSTTTADLESWLFVRAADKYQIARATESIEYAVRLSLFGSTAPPLVTCISAFFIGSQLELRELKVTSLKSLVEHSPSITILRQVIQGIEEASSFYGPGEHLLQTMRGYYETTTDTRLALDRKLLSGMESSPSSALTKYHYHVRKPAEKRSIPCDDRFATLLLKWTQSSQYRCASALKSYIDSSMLEGWECGDCKAELRSKLEAQLAVMDVLEGFSTL